MALEPEHWASAGPPTGEEHSMDTWSGVHSGEGLLPGRCQEVTLLRAGDVGLEWLRVCWVSFEMMGCSSEALWVIYLKSEEYLWRALIYVGGVGVVTVRDKKQMKGRGSENCRNGAGGTDAGSMEVCRSQEGH